MVPCMGDLGILFLSYSIYTKILLSDAFQTEDSWDICKMRYRRSTHTATEKKHVFPLYLIEYGVGPWMTKDVFLL